MDRRLRGKAVGILGHKSPSRLLCFRFGIAALTDACDHFSSSLNRIPSQYLHKRVPDTPSCASANLDLVIAISRRGNPEPQRPIRFDLGVLASLERGAFQSRLA